MSCKVQVSITYSRRCLECVSYVNRTVSAAVVDGQVTGVTLKAVAQCEHEKASAEFNVPTKARAKVGHASTVPGAPLPGQTSLIEMPGRSPYDEGVQ